MKIRKNIKATVALQEAPGTNLRRIVEKSVFDELVNLLSPGVEPFKPKKGKPNVIMFVGLQGAGKTTTIAKYANWYKRKGWKTCMVCADTFRAGAFDQLKQNATRVKVPFYGSYTEPDPVKIAQEGVDAFKKDNYEIIIVDTSGRHKQEDALLDEMKEVEEAVHPDDIIFVLDSTIGQMAQNQAKAFKSKVNIGSVIITKLDGHAKGGGALSAVAATGAPIIFLGEGEHFDSLELFEPRSFVSRLLGLGDVKGLMNEIKDAGILDGNKESMQRLQKGLFTIRDMREQFENVLKLGPMDRIMSMIPGLPQGMFEKGQEKEGVERVKRFIYMMDSMNEKELDCKVPMTESRILRICRGSGTHPAELQQLLTCHKSMEKVVGKMGKSNLLNDAAMMKNFERNPNQMMQQLMKSVDPRMLQQMGGAGGMMNMMKQFSGGMGGGKMKDMMKQFGM